MLLTAHSLFTPLANLPVSRPAFVKPAEFVGSYSKKLHKLCPQAAKAYWSSTRLPPKCTHPKFVWPATMRPILTVRSVLNAL